MQSVFRVASKTSHYIDYIRVIKALFLVSCPLLQALGVYRELS